MNIIIRLGLIIKHRIPAFMRLESEYELRTVYISVGLLLIPLSTETLFSLVWKCKILLDFTDVSLFIH